MRLGNTTKYALEAMAFLIRPHARDQWAQIASIAETCNIPRKYLEQVLLDLKNAGLVESKKGQHGGYRLSRRPDEISLGEVLAAVSLLDEGATVPFIARYRKEVTEGLDDTQLRNLETRLAYLREMEDRRATILTSIDEQGKLTDELRAEIDAADSKSRLEDLYLPYKQKRRTRAQIAREAGLEPLADGLLQDPPTCPKNSPPASWITTRAWPMPRPHWKAPARS